MSIIKNNNFKKSKANEKKRKRDRFYKWLEHNQVNQKKEQANNKVSENKN